MRSEYELFPVFRREPCYHTSKLPDNAWVKMHFWFFNEDCLDSGSMNLRQHVHNLIHSEPVVYQKAWHSSSRLFCRLEKRRGGARRGIHSEVTVKNLNCVDRYSGR